MAFLRLFLFGAERGTARHQIILIAVKGKGAAGIHGYFFGMGPIGTGVDLIDKGSHDGKAMLHTFQRSIKQLLEQSCAPKGSVETLFYTQLRSILKYQCLLEKKKYDNL